MHRNTVWLIFLGIISICTVAYTAVTLWSIYQYQALSQTTRPKAIDWSVLKIGDEFSPQALYQFEFKNNLHQGKTIWEERYLNYPTAQEAIDRLKKQPLPVWFSPSNPSHSSLQKNFPYKQSASAVFLWFLWLYFMSIGHYVAYHLRGKIGGGKQADSHLSSRNRDEPDQLQKK